jgi:plastocyanin
LVSPAAIASSQPCSPASADVTFTPFLSLFNREGNDETVYIRNRAGPCRASGSTASHRSADPHLKTLSGAEFDKAYVDHEVVYHQQVLDAIDKTLVPNASNAELKALLVKVRPAIAAHLDHAKMLQASLSAKHTTTIDGTAFTPRRVSVKVGDSVTWTNKDPFAHTVTSRAGGFDSKTIVAGGSWTYLATRAGEFPYVCALHPAMKGTLIVE